MTFSSSIRGGGLNVYFQTLQTCFATRKTHAKVQLFRVKVTIYLREFNLLGIIALNCMPSCGG